MKKKKYLKPQVHVVQTEPCMVNNLSQVRIYRGRFQPDFVNAPPKLKMVF